MLSNPKFHPLREMESFTDKMFNRIIAFQEKQFPTWNDQLSFEERIKDLPLHNFVFSNPDRDPNLFGPTVAHYYPLGKEIQRLAHYIKEISNHLIVCDMYPGNGLIGSLLSREGLKTIGLATNDAKPMQIPRLYDPQNYAFTNKSLQAVDCDIVFCSWPPAMVNPTPEILLKKPKLIIYISTEHQSESDEPQVGTADMLSDVGNYQCLEHWSITRPKDLLHSVWPDMTPSVAETRVVHVYASPQTIEEHPVMTQLPAKDYSLRYDWEKDLTIIELALEAKSLIETRSF